MLTYPWAIQKTRQCFFLKTIQIQNSSIRKSSFASFEGDKEEVKSVLFLNRNFQMKIICWQLQSIKKQSWQKRLIYVVEVKNNIYIKYIWFFLCLDPKIVNNDANKVLEVFFVLKKKCYFLCVNFLVTLFTPYCHSWHTQVCLQLFGPRSRFSTCTSKHKLPYRTFEPNFCFPGKLS